MNGGAMSLIPKYIVATAVVIFGGTHIASAEDCTVYSNRVNRLTLDLSRISGEISSLNSAPAGETDAAKVSREARRQTLETEKSQKETERATAEKNEADCTKRTANDTERGECKAAKDKLTTARTERNKTCARAKVDLGLTRDEDTSDEACADDLFGSTGLSNFKQIYDTNETKVKDAEEKLEEKRDKLKDLTETKTQEIQALMEQIEADQQAAADEAQRMLDEAQDKKRQNEEEKLVDERDIAKLESDARDFAPNGPQVQAAQSEYSVAIGDNQRKCYAQSQALIKSLKEQLKAARQKQGSREQLSRASGRDKRAAQKLVEDDMAECQASGIALADNALARVKMNIAVNLSKVLEQIIEKKKEIAKKLALNDEDLQRMQAKSQQAAAKAEQTRQRKMAEVQTKSRQFQEQSAQIAQDIQKLEREKNEAQQKMNTARTQITAAGGEVEAGDTSNARSSVGDARSANEEYAASLEEADKACCIDGNPFNDPLCKVDDKGKGGHGYLDRADSVRGGDR